MTVQSTHNRKDYTGTGSTDTYAYDFKITAASQLVVKKIDTDGNITTLVLTTDYTVTGVGSVSGGNVVLVAGNLPLNYKLKIRRVVPKTQLTSIKNQGSFLPEVHENAFDKAMMIAQEHEEEIGRSTKLPDTVPVADFDPTLPADMADNPGATLVVNETGDGLDLGPTVQQIEDATEATAAAQAAAEAAKTAAETAETNAETAEANAETAEANAEAAALAAQNAVAAVQWNDVVYIDSGDSPFSITNAHRGKLIVADASGGAISVVLPQISSLDLTSPFATGVKKSDDSGNAVTVTRSGSDTIDDGQTSIVVGAQNYGVTLIPDTDQSPDNWTSFQSGVITFDIVVDPFTGDGVEDTFELSHTPASLESLEVIVGGVPQTLDAMTLVGDELTFDAPPANLAGIQVRHLGRALPIGTPGDGTVTAAKLAEGLTDIQVFTANGTWTKPAHGTITEVICIGPGGGGGSGRKGIGSAPSDRSGGGGGGAGGKSRKLFPTSALGATEPVVVGIGGAGGAAQATNSTNGNAGSPGSSNTSFGNHVKALPGEEGAAGADGGGSGGNGRGGLEASGGNGGNGTNVAGGAGVTQDAFASSGGGGGGGLDTSNTIRAGGAGGAITPTYGNGTTAGGAAGASDGGDGGAGVANDAQLYASGGGGGGSSNTGNAGDGGDGGGYGAGGGGGGAATDDAGNSGAGGDGADGYCIVITYR